MSTPAIICIAVILSILLIALIFILCLPRMIFKFVFLKPKRTTKVPKFYIDTPHYKVSQKGLKFMKTLPNDNVYIYSQDNLRLHGYFFPFGEERKKFIIGIHGYKSYSRPEFAPFFEFYRSMGYNILLPDDRAHAPSQGEYIGMGVMDRLDALTWANYLINTYGKDIEIVFHGVSMGGATVCALSGEEQLPPQVKAIVSDCAYTSCKDIFTYQLKKSMHLPAKYLLPAIEKICIKKTGFNFTAHSPIEQIKNAKVPMLFVHGKQDNFVPFDMADKLYNACGSEKKKLIAVDNAGHGESIAFARNEYESAIKELVS